MNLSGRFNFWRVLIHTRAITPPRVTSWLSQSVATLTLGNWAWLLVGVAVLVAVTLRFALPGQPTEPPRIEPGPVPAPSAVSTPRLPW